MTGRRICEKLQTPEKQVKIILAVQEIRDEMKQFNADENVAIERATKGFSKADKRLTVALWKKGIVSLEKLTELFISETIRSELPSKHKELNYEFSSKHNS